jgi:hypothetical protein
MEKNTNIIKHSFNDLMTMAKVFAESGMFADTKQTAQAFVKIQAGNEIDIPPFQSMTGIHIIVGKTVIGGGIIASRIKGSGKYDYKVVEISNEKCSIDFFEGKTKIGTSNFTIEDAKKAGTKNIEKFPRNMLFNRAISNGVKWFTPDVFSGPVYVPEEMQELVTNKVEEVKATDIKQNEAAEKYLKFIDENKFYFTADECDLFSKGCEEWSAEKIEKAMSRLTKIVNEKKLEAHNLLNTEEK